MSLFPFSASASMRRVNMHSAGAMPFSVVTTARPRSAAAAVCMQHPAGTAGRMNIRPFRMLQIY